MMAKLFLLILLALNSFYLTSCSNADPNIKNIRSMSLSSNDTDDGTTSEPPHIDLITSSLDWTTHWLGVGDVVYIQVHFNKPVQVIPSSSQSVPKLELNTSLSLAYAYFVSGNNTNTLTFKYTVALGQNSDQLDTIGDKIILNGASIIDANNSLANVSLPTVISGFNLGSQSNIIIDTTSPGLPNIAGAPIPNSSSNKSSLQITVSSPPSPNDFANYIYKVVSVTSLSSCEVKTGYSQSQSIDLKIDYTLPTIDGSYILCIIGIDRAKNQSLPRSLQWTKDTIPPYVTKVTSSAPNGIWHGIGKEIEIQIELSESINYASSSDSPTLDLNIPSVLDTNTNIKAQYNGISSNLLKFKYTVANGNYTQKLNYNAIDSLKLNGAIIKDSAGNPLHEILPAINSGNDLGSMNAIKIDGIIPSSPSDPMLGSGNISPLWLNSSQSTPAIYFTNVIDSESGISKYEVKAQLIKSSSSFIDTTTYTAVSNGGTATFSSGTFSENQTYQLIIRSVDNAGNASTEVIIPQKWIVDLTPPDISGFIPQIGPIPKNDLSLKLTPVFYNSNGTLPSDALSGIDKYLIYYQEQISGSLELSAIGSIINSNGLYLSKTSSFLNSDSTYKINKIRAIDKANNSIDIIFDKTWDTIKCPNHYIVVPYLIDSNYSSGFCVAKYEMKILDSDGAQLNGNTSYDTSFKADSRPNSTPWVNIRKGQAKNKCTNLGPKYNLISNQQWQYIAQNAEQLNSNWYHSSGSGTRSINFMYVGHSNNNPPQTLDASLDDLNSFEGTMNSADGSFCSMSNCPEQKRTLNLSNGEVIWDFAGNVEEWIRDESTSNSGFTVNGGNSWYWVQYSKNDFESGSVGTISIPTVSSSTSTALHIFGPQGNPINGIDYLSLFLSPQNGGLGHASLFPLSSINNNKGITRGGSYDSFDRSGAFNVKNNFETADIAPNIGFRCVYSPLH